MKANSVKLPFDQVPHVVLNHPKMTGSHLFIFIRLYKVLKDHSYCCYSNKKIHEQTNISLRTIDCKLHDLESWGFINRAGIGFNRKIYRGEILNNTAKIAEQKNNNNAKTAETSAKNDIGHRKNCVHTNNKLRNITKKDLDFYKPLYQQYKSRMLSARTLKLESGNVEILEFEEWIRHQKD